MDFTLPARARLIACPDLCDPVAADTRLTPAQLLAAIPMGHEEVVDLDTDDVSYDELPMEALFAAAAPSLAMAGARGMDAILPDLMDLEL